MKRMIQGLTLPLAQHQRENVELSATRFEREYVHFLPSSHDPK